MRSFKRKLYPSICLLALLVCWAAQPVAGLAAEAAPARVAVLPFSMHTPSQLHYLQDGIRDMLTSRLSAPGKVTVIEAAATQQAMGSIKGDVSAADAVRIGKTLRADHVLYGSVTSMGQAISIDAKMASVSGDKEPLSLFAQTKGLDDVIPKVNQFALEINQKVFGRTGEASMASADDNVSVNRNPELLLPGSAMANKDRISYINPNFVEITPESALRQGGIWRSQTFNGGTLGMDMGDIDGDGKMELVTVTWDTVTAYRREANGLRVIGSYKGTNTDNFIWVTLVDTNRDKVPEIFVTNLKKKLSTRSTGDEASMGDRGYTEDVGSFCLSLAGGKLQPVGKPVPYFLNGVVFPGRGKVLLGQQKGSVTDGPFMPTIVEMQLMGSTLTTGQAMALPEQCNVFNFAVGDINNDRANEYVVINRQRSLLILSHTGEQLWKSEDTFGATTNSFEGKVMDRRFNFVENYSLPCNMLITDLNKDGIPEIVLNRNTDTKGALLPQGLQYWERGEIVSLSWDQQGLVENWKTKEISGMVTSLRVGDLKNDGSSELVLSLVLAKDFLKLWESKSTILSYDLNVGSAKGSATAEAKSEDTGDQKRDARAPVKEEKKKKK
ncbi:MAG: FG-GAP-like repeat-containing protein [Syntrophobacteraceae bacterium]